MRIFGVRSLLSFSSHLDMYPVPQTFNSLYALGSMAGLMLVNQIITGALLAMHYSPSTLYAFDSVNRIMTDIPSGWLIRYMHAGGAHMFFIVLYLHIGKAFYYRSYRKKALWSSGIVIFLLVMAAAFLGYVLPWGQMSYWGSTVITNLFDTILKVGPALRFWILGGYTVSNATLLRFFVIHVLLPIIVAILAIVHIILLHDSGSSQPQGIGGLIENCRFNSNAIIKDLYFCSLFLGFLSVLIIFFFPNFLGHSDNYIRANPLVTPKHIVPEWYFLPYYAMLRGMPSKPLGTGIMAGSLVILFVFPFFCRFEHQSMKFSKLGQFFTWVFFGNFILLGYAGARPSEGIYLLYSQAATLYYFLYLLFILPFLSFIEKHALCNPKRSIPRGCFTRL
jgi:quinol-cytochrome oxidoreductase complex cytochrome b subunit